jgi:hypothetical protein
MAASREEGGTRNCILDGQCLYTGVRVVKTGIAERCVRVQGNCVKADWRVRDWAPCPGWYSWVETR